MKFLRGTSRWDRLNGTDNSDVIFSLGGDDTVFADAGNDFVNGGAGNDFLDGGLGNDILMGGFGSDDIRGGDGDDVLVDGLLTPSGTGFDLPGIPYINSIPNINIFNFSVGNIPLLGSVGAGSSIVPPDTMSGGNGNDVLVSLGGNDVMDGGDGDDTFLITGPGSKIVYGGAGNDRSIDLKSSSLFGLANLGQARLEGVGVTALGGPGNDFLTGTFFDDLLFGEDDSDILECGRGNDFLNGGLGRDILTGNAGSDIFEYGQPADGLDAIIDFTQGDDMFHMDLIGFGGGLSLGPLPADRFIAGSDPVPVASGDGVFLYDTDSGVLAWDADGPGGNLATSIVLLSNTAALTASDFLIV